MAGNQKRRALMDKDWQVYERFVDEVMATGSVAELSPVLDRFA